VGRQCATTDASGSTSGSCPMLSGQCVPVNPGAASGLTANGTPIYSGVCTSGSGYGYGVNVGVPSVYGVGVPSAVLF
jgi:hypothetical protein